MSDPNPLPDPRRYDALPLPLVERDQWVCWRLAARVKGGPLTKVPFVAGRDRWASSQKPATWRPFAAALEAWGRGTYDGIGFVFADSDPLFGADLDNSLDPDGTPLDWARPYFDAFGPSYGERSPSRKGVTSRKGVKFYCLGRLPGEGRGRNRRGLGPDGKGAVEIYGTARFFAVTGDRHPLCGAAVEGRNDALQRVYPTLKKADAYAKPAAPRAFVRHAGDEVVIEKVTACAKWARLWNGDTTGYGSHSEADLALCGRIGFFVGWDPCRVENLFGQSALTRGKWDERADYRKATLDRAVAGKGECYDWDKPRGAK